MNTVTATTPWIKGSRCSGDGADCIEAQVGRPDGLAFVRDSSEENPTELLVSATGFRAFTAAVQVGQFDDC